MTKIQFQDFQHLEIKAAFWLLSQIHYISVLWGFANLPQTCNYCNFYALKKPNICILVFVNCKELYIYIYMSIVLTNLSMSENRGPPYIYVVINKV